MKDHFEMVEQMSGVRYELPPGYDFSPQIRHLVSLVIFKTFCSMIRPLGCHSFLICCTALKHDDILDSYSSSVNVDLPLFDI